MKAQFDLQASNFDRWSVQRNRDYLAAYSRFCRVSSSDELLDLACGTCEFLAFTAPRVKRVVGVDISEGMLEVGRASIAQRGISNVELVCHDVTQVPFGDGAFSIVTCRNALHHMSNYYKTIEEMARCCRRGGKVSTLDIAAYADPQVDSYFEHLEKMIDVSHGATLTRQMMLEAFQTNGLTIERTFETEVELGLREYLGHAAVKLENQGRIERHVEFGLARPDLAAFWLEREGTLFFKRSVVAVLATR